MHRLQVMLFIILSIYTNNNVRFRIVCEKSENEWKKRKNLSAMAANNL
tara:strand:- start:395 stop:538 length:144 start_codon:yes stop_codon:yes gene_type:complete